MFQPDRYSFIPPLQKRHLPFVVAWIVVVVIIALISSRGASARSRRSSGRPPLKRRIPHYAVAHAHTITVDRLLLACGRSARCGSSHAVEHHLPDRSGSPRH